MRKPIYWYILCKKSKFSSQPFQINVANHSYFLYFLISNKLFSLLVIARWRSGAPAEAPPQDRPCAKLLPHWLSRGGRGCRDSNDVRAHLKNALVPTTVCLPNPTCFMLSLGTTLCLKKLLEGGKTETPRQELDFSLLCGKRLDVSLAQRLTLASF